MTLSAAILAGGASRRMGRDKAMIPFDGQPLVCRVAERLRACSDDVFVVGKHVTPFEGLGLRAVADESATQTPVAGILTALRAARHGVVFVCACDMPFVSPEFAKMLGNRVGGVDAVVPLRNGRPEPSHAAWSTRAVEAVESALRDGELAVHRVLEHLRVEWVDEDDWRAVDPQGQSLVNVNTPDDLDSARRGSH